MAERLRHQPGEWIDRERPVRFRFEGRPLQGFEGDVLCSALWASGLRLLGRSFKYHRPRGIYSLAGHDAAVLVDDGRRTNLRGDMLALSEGLDVRAVNTRGGLEADRLRSVGHFAAFLPVGFYYKAFHTPRRLFPFYERRMRAMAGLGHVDSGASSDPTPKRYDFCDLLVVGGGPAGLSAALAAAEQGAHVVLADEMAQPGGTLCYQHGGDDTSRQVRADLLGRAAALPNLDLRPGTQVAGAYSDLWFALVDGQCLTKMRARAVVLATGCFEQPAVFGHNDLPGVMLATAAQRLIHCYAVKPFQRAVVLAANESACRTALDLHAAGVEVHAVVDLRPDGEPGPLGRDLAAAGIPVKPGWCVYEAAPARARRHIVGATICPLDGRGEPDTARAERIDCDGIAVGVGWAPAAGLLHQVGARFAWCDPLQQFVPDVLPEAAFAAGRVNGVYGLDAQRADGRRAGLGAAALLGRHAGPVPDVPDRTPPHGSPPSHPYPIYAHARRKNFVELDEDLHLSDFVHAVQEGYDNIELLKRYTTVGMGPSQGKLANMNAIRILARLTGRSIQETGSPTARPFHQPVSLRHLAGRRFHPHRHTPMDGWHREHGARFVDAGTWKRAEHYAIDGATRAQAIGAEAQHVRQAVGIIDVSTLGKIEVCGPDAMAMLERTYTTRFDHLSVGRFRYGIACDESGVLADDGVIARTGPDRYYVTATTSGVDALFREMQRNALLWGLNVALVNATGRFAAMNVAGPGARALLQPLTDVDLSADAFAYVGVRQGSVADVPATILRTGFVGELGYEVHVPACAGHHVWRTIMAAGGDHGLRPFGLEAQRLLRLEKGHIIVSQDTDALTTPREVGLEWAIAVDKPFFVGQRSLAIVARQPLTRRLVGFAFDADHDGPLPDECHLVLAGDQIAGRVTSIAPRTTLGHAIGLAFVQPDLSAAGTRLDIRVAEGRLVHPRVVATPFYDPENERQKGA